MSNPMLSSVADKALWELVKDFIPEKIFDAHAHLMSPEFLPADSTYPAKYGDCTAEAFLERSKAIYGERHLRGMLMIHPDPSLADEALRDSANQWMLEQVSDVPGCCVGAYILPTDSEEKLEELVKNPKIRAFKPYYMTALGDKGGQSDIADFLPESAWVVANRHGLAITLHMMKTLSPADPVNKAYIKEMAAKYSNAKLILAHCGRGFAAWHILQTAREYKEFPNIYYDMAAICEPSAMFEVIRQSGADHVMWGTDFPLAIANSVPFCFADGSSWISPSQPGLENKKIGMLGLESLFAFYQASLMLDLTRQDIEDIFYNNAISVFGLA